MSDNNTPKDFDEAKQFLLEQFQSNINDGIFMGMQNMYTLFLGFLKQLEIKDDDSINVKTLKEFFEAVIEEQKNSNEDVKS